MRVWDRNNIKFCYNLIHLSSPIARLAMSMETLEFIIYPDGRVKETVTGIVGASCQEVTAAIEAQLGRVVSQEKSSEHFSSEVNQSANTANRVNLSQW